MNADPGEARYANWDAARFLESVATPTPSRPFELEAALRSGVSVEELAAASFVDPWFLDRIAEIVEGRSALLQAIAADGVLGLGTRE